MDMGSHDEGCGGAHTADVTCAYVTAYRAWAKANPWYCDHGRSGYHWFGSDDPEQQCRHEGCDRTQGECDAWTPVPPPTMEAG